MAGQKTRPQKNGRQQEDIPFVEGQEEDTPVELNEPPVGMEDLSELLRASLPPESSVIAPPEPKMIPVTAAEELSKNTFVAELKAELNRAFYAEAHAHQNFSATNCLIKTVEEQIRPLQSQLTELKARANWEYGRIQQAHLAWEGAKARLQEHCPTQE